MKKIFQNLTLKCLTLIWLLLFLSPCLVQAATSIPSDLRPGYAPQGFEELYGGNSDPAQNFDDRSVTYILADIAVVLLQIAGVLTVYFIITNGFNYVKAFGQEEEIQKAKKGLTWAIIGLLVVLMSYAIVQNILKITLSVDTPTTTNTTTTTTPSTPPATAP
ncbi:MAG: hypothetical protein UT55_C0068G0004 [Candidatus Peregrinibacteria bacterium GW2011_GWE2_39_6]|nr:MAG: hypothetical protein UT36_C0006G0046 [Candidatus Peregrinibacteria bacterium GW2011_GWF2_39_17]KKR24223.1 MAG: hypothetical protein UT55_C0068G0004 [Candidatus Peregrinibacteria bacterium GW2011_GWE2_39_6]HCW32792.1 hypothetical protein [Candidatus Peregrinibacteria bacterium]